MKRQSRGEDASHPPGMLIVTQYFEPERGAAQVRLAALADALSRRGHAVEVVTSIPNYPLGRFFDGWSSRPVQIEQTPERSITRVWVYAAMGGGPKRMLNYLSFGVMSVVGILRSRRPRWVVVEYPTLPGALPAVLWARLTGRRVVLLVADLWVDSIVEIGSLPDGAVVSLLRAVERWMLRQCHVVTAVTEGVRDALLAKGVRDSQLAWLPNGVDTTMFAPDVSVPKLAGELGLADGTEVVVYAGTHGYVHGLDVVLDAAERLTSEPIHFLLVGDGSEKPRLVADARARGLENVTFHDPVSPREVSRLLNGAIAGLATVREGDLYRTIRSAKSFPVMACGRPLVYSGDDEGSRLVADAGAGPVVPPGDGGALADAVSKLLADRDLVERLGAQGRAWVLANAGWDQLVAAWVDELGLGDLPRSESLGPVR